MSEIRETANRDHNTKAVWTTAAGLSGEGFRKCQIASGSLTFVIQYDPFAERKRLADKHEPGFDFLLQKRMVLAHPHFALHQPRPAGGADGAAAGMRRGMPGLDGGAQDVQPARRVHAEIAALPGEQQGHGSLGRGGVVFCHFG